MYSHTVKLVARHDLTTDEIEELEQQVYQSHQPCTVRGHPAPIGFTLQAGGTLVGAAYGHTWAGICGLRRLWIDERHRGRGHGRRLLLEVISEARSRHCNCIYVASGEAQASFFERFGFRPTTILNGRAAGQVDILLRLTLDQPAANDATHLHMSGPTTQPSEKVTYRAAGLY